MSRFYRDFGNVHPFFTLNHFTMPVALAILCFCPHTKYNQYTIILIRAHCPAHFSIQSPTSEMDSLYSEVQNIIAVDSRAAPGDRKLIGSGTNPRTKHHQTQNGDRVKRPRRFGLAYAFSLSMPPFSTKYFRTSNHVS